ncbi:retrovirus-related Pol polyprotein LINE-1 [Elysia marginata]|uniref:Retrovirus-related Pol polyprotein LINE-1 n=1 Tax=Elysia marginata TaxID=1093978 RepID=A0AAV4F3V7_9GAST|nr:retrovirus-related Pol polyprotein LINE-1 [Elysia marginata]
MISPFQGEPKPLEKPIKPEEVRKSFNSLSNNKAPGEDEIHAELLKYGTPLLDQTIADIFNTTFKKHEKIDINGGVLIAIQKPRKKKGPPNNLRPITLLNSLRKALSVITLNRVRPDVERYLSNSQSGFRPNRSTADVVWTHKWLSAKTLKEDVPIKITGIDMSAAFDTINRRQILDILKIIMKEDELRMIRFLLRNTEINTKINGSSKAMPVMSNVGTPQGDSLSPVLFTIYLENALREIRTTLPEPNSSYGREIPSEIAYTDDVDLIGHDYANIAKIQETLEKYQLKVNIDKTEFTLLSKSEEDWKKVKKVGSLIDDNEDIERRKQLSSTALTRLNNLLHSSDELDKITALTQDRRQWHEMTVKIERAAEASQTENWDAPRH